MPTIGANVKELKQIQKDAPREHDKMIGSIIGLYEKRQLLNFKTAKNAIDALASKKKLLPKKVKGYMMNLWINTKM